MKKRERDRKRPEKFSARIGKSSGINRAEGYPEKKKKEEKRRAREKLGDQMRESLCESMGRGIGIRERQGVVDRTRNRSGIKRKDSRK